MKFLRTKKEVSWGLLAGFIATLMSANQQADEPVSFDLLFPQNWYTNTLHGCMETWADLDTLRSDDGESTLQHFLLIDAAIGRIAYCIHCVSQSYQEEQEVSTRVHDEDLAYLVKLVYTLENKCEGLVGRRFDDKLACLQYHIKKLRIQLYELLKPNDASLSASQ